MVEFKLNGQAHLAKDIFSDALEKAGTRDGWGRALVELGKEDENVYALTADLSGSVRTSWFEKEFPERFVQCGVAEQNMAGVAAGIAMEGKTVFFSSFAAFSPGRNWDQIRVCIAYNNLNVKFSGAHSGITVGPDGATHQALEDIALMRVLPNVIVLSPSDYEEAKKCVFWAAKTKGPVYIRVGREKVPKITTENTPFEIGKALLLKDGKDVAIFATGVCVYQSLLAAKQLAQEGIDAAVLNFHTIKPIDVEAIREYGEKCRCIVTAEEHQVNGGFGSAVCEVACENKPVPIIRVGMKDEFGESGNGMELLKKHGMAAGSIAKAAKLAMEKRR